MWNWLKIAETLWGFWNKDEGPGEVNKLWNWKVAKELFDKFGEEGFQNV